jgi:hypothetical protein
VSLGKTSLLPQGSALAKVDRSTKCPGGKLREVPLDKTLPQFFFKYTTRSTAKIVLETQKLRWSTAARLNDPYDLQFDLHLEIDPAKLKRMALDKLFEAWYGSQPYKAAPGNLAGILVERFRDRAPKLTREDFDAKFGPSVLQGLTKLQDNLSDGHAALRQLATKVTILCQSAVGDSLLMWAYYAEQHKGAVLRFKPSVELDSVWLAAKPVRYARTMPRLHDEESLSNILAGVMRTDENYLRHSTFYTKALEWAHEQEWRLCNEAGTGSAAQYEDVGFHKQELDAVTLGCAMPEEDRTAIAALARSRYPHAEVLQARKHDMEFKLIFEKAS